MKFLRIQHGRPPPFRKSINRRNSATVPHTVMKFGMKTHCDPLNLVTDKNLIFNTPRRWTDDVQTCLQSIH